MRELVFELEYEPGHNTVADTLAEYPDVRSRSLSLHATTDSLWRVDHVTGDADALAVVVGDMGMSLGVTGNAMRLARLEPDPSVDDSTTSEESA